MTAKFLGIFALAAFALTVWAQSYNAGGRGADSSPPATNTASTNASAKTVAINARMLFLRNCAHCHGATAHGDDGPDLHGLDVTSQWIANRIRKGKAGQMTAFAGKLQPAEIDALVAYVQSLK
jgi:mono/diheme cytochrome c family protein